VHVASTCSTTLGQPLFALVQIQLKRWAASQSTNFGAQVHEHAGAWTIVEPNAAWMRFRSPEHALEFIVRLRAIRIAERLREDGSPETTSSQLTEADVQLRAFPCERCRRPFQFRALPQQLRSLLKDLNLRLPEARRKPGAIRTIRELRRTTGCSAADASGIYDHLSAIVGRHPLEREHRCHQCDAALVDASDFQDCGRCGALNLLL
jgi:hypothetical protein